MALENIFGRMPWVIVPLLLFLACVPSQYSNTSHLSHCDQMDERVHFNNRIETLNYLTSAFYLGCHEKVIEYGTRAQTEYKYKTFSILKETTEFFLPEGTITDYILESYERGYLSLMIALSYLKLEKHESSAVELRKLNTEINSKLYNYGEDPINILFQAVLWDRLGEPAESRVDWHRLEEEETINERLRQFASRQVQRIDSHIRSDQEWKIYSIGQFPNITWNLEFINAKNGYFSVYPQRDFIKNCFSSTGLRISTKDWFNKIAIRHSNGYHPLVNVKSWIRLPVGIAYGITTFSSGAAIMVSGCAIDAYAGGSGSLCEIAIRGGGAVMAESPKVFEFTLKPDLRHWDTVPGAFLFTTTENIKMEKCRPKFGNQRVTRRML